MKPQFGTRCGTSSRASRTREPNDPTSRGATTSTRQFGESPDYESVVEDAGFPEAGDDRFEAEPQERHPLLQKSMDLLLRLHTLFGDDDPRFARALATLHQGAGDAMGGLAQALSDRDDDAVDFGLRVVQLKRALRGAAFARGALFPLRSAMSRGRV